MKFSELGIHDDLLDAISYMGFNDATPIQEKAIPAILGGNDLIACAQTGTGKTAAFVLPILDLIADLPAGDTSTLIIVPTRELAIQIDQQVYANFPMHLRYDATIRVALFQFHHRANTYMNNY